MARVSEPSVLAYERCDGDVAILLFELVVFLAIPHAVQMARLRRREHERFGERILPGGDMYEQSQAFLAWAASYDEGGMDIMVDFDERVIRLSVTKTDTPRLLPMVGEVWNLIHKLWQESKNPSAHVFPYTDTEMKAITPYSPNGTRTRVFGVRGRYPRPLDDGAIYTFHTLGS
jgi:hypothetical protein